VRRWLLAAAAVGTFLSMVGPSVGAASRAPAYAGDFPDPSVLTTQSAYYAYATQSGRTNVQVLASRDLRTWRQLPDALPVLPSWALPGHTWAPAVWRRSGRYVLYYTTRSRATGRQCISAAVAPTPRGPFRDRSTAPLVCQAALGGSIDPDPFVDAHGRPHLTWKSDGNALGQRTWLWSQRLTDDGLHLGGAASRLLAQERPWEGPLVEAPTFVQVGRHLLLFYSANRYDTSRYAIGYARCSSSTGPCRKVTTRVPWLASRAGAPGPGGQAFFRDRSGGWRVAYHAWTPGRVGYDNGGRRAMWVEPVSFAGGRPRLR
jgi:beta-xylosidase